MSHSTAVDWHGLSWVNFRIRLRELRLSSFGRIKHTLNDRSAAENGPSSHTMDNSVIFLGEERALLLLIASNTRQ
jgi:hypothetical protein